jgi:hypothetical protein
MSASKPWKVSRGTSAFISPGEPRGLIRNPVVIDYAAEPVHDDTPIDVYYLNELSAVCEDLLSQNHRATTTLTRSVTGTAVTA